MFKVDFILQRESEAEDEINESQVNCYGPRWRDRATYGILNVLCYCDTECIRKVEPKT